MNPLSIREPLKTGPLDEDRDTLGAHGPGRSFGAHLSHLARQYAIAWICLAMLIYLGASSDVFLSRTNVTNMLDQWATVGIIACAGTFVLISRMFDLSVGATYALSGVVCATVAVNTGSVVLGFASALGAGVLVGLGNGLAVAGANINPFIVTLATSLIITGVAVYISGGLLVTVSDPAFTRLGQGSLGALTIPGLTFLVVAALGWFVLSRTTFGRHVFAVGGNPEAARLSGVRVQATHIVVFVVSGLSAAVAGALAASRVGAGQADVGASLPLIVIAVIVVGGTSIFGGQGAMWRTLLGVLLFAMVGNGFTLLNVNANVQQVIQGAILLMAVGIDAWSRKSGT